MAGRKGPKAVREKTEASKIGAGGAAGGTASTAAEAAAVTTVTEPVTLEPGGSQLHEEQSASPRGRAETPEGEVQEVDEEEADEDEEDGEITDQARELRRLEHTSRTSQGCSAKGTSWCIKPRPEIELRRLKGQSGRPKMKETGYSGKFRGCKEQGQ